ncbi:MAG: TonB-dependent receptor [Verrucomicrobia bacterium]|nr:TonB-dependent receptor [Verrucomicrobiota bacterium]
MNMFAVRMTPAATASLALLLVVLNAPASAQTTPARPDDKDEKIVMSEFTVTSATRTEKAIDHIPGSVMSISRTEIANVQAASLDPNQILAQTIPGYSASYDDLTTSGELLRGRRPQFFVDGVLMSTPLRDVGRMSSGMVDPMLIDRIEVVNGSSAIEGLGGSGGIINYITKVPTQEGVVSTVQAALETQFKSKKIGWKVTGLTMVKRDNVDFLVSLGRQDRPMYYDARDNLEYINSNGSYEDSTANSVAAKAGINFGADKRQRLQLTFNDYELVGNNNYNSVTPGNRALGIVQAAKRGPNPGPGFKNFMRMETLNYTNTGVFDGTLKAIAYHSHEILANNGVNDPSKQDPAFGPIGTLIDASQIISKKQGLKAYWVKSDFIVPGFEFNVGYDHNEDTTYQNLLMTQRTWLPEMKFKADSGYTQMSYDLGPLTLSGGARYQTGTVSVPTFRTLYNTAPATNGVVFIGGSKKYSTSVFNLGAVYRLSTHWSTFVGFTQGYDLPDIGTVIRNTNKPNQSMATTGAVNPVLTKNYEAGVNWHGRTFSAGADIYYNTSPSSTAIITDPTTGIQSVLRNPAQREGFEFNGEWKFAPGWKVSGTYSKMLAYTSLAPGQPVNLTIIPASTTGQEPDKIVARLDWTPTKQLSFDLVGSHFCGQELNVGRGAANYWKTTQYNRLDGSVSYKTDSWGTLAIGCSNMTNTFQIVNENGTANNTYYAIQGRKFEISDTVSF